MPDKERKFLAHDIKKQYKIPLYSGIHKDNTDIKKQYKIPLYSGIHKDNTDNSTIQWNLVLFLYISIVFVYSTIQWNLVLFLYISIVFVYSTIQWNHTDIKKQYKIPLYSGMHAENGTRDQRIQIQRLI
jgi:hypothetical protein